MKASDKIYTIPVGTYDTKPIPDLQDNIYIRKDALLEWLEDMKFMAKSERVGAYQNVIDKLNKM